MRVVRRIFSRAHLYILWFFFAFLSVGFLFSRLGDTDAAHKVTLYADVPSMRDTELAAELERELPEGIRMVKVHPFSYAMFDSYDLPGADLYIIPESAAEDYLESMRAIGGAGFDEEDGYYRDGVLWGVRVWCAEEDKGAAAAWIDYPDENCWLFFNKDSLHVYTLSGAGDDAAIDVARHLLALTDGAG